ncbi:MAG: hypothetical protein JWM27_1951 [Gemmatimonadetes bacterium]|nr:hypothetical protein [Gemmatimonadota bacterium]
MPDRPDRSAYPVRKLGLHDPEPADMRRPTPDECIEMMWELAQNAWAFMGVENAEPGLHRHVVRVVRRGS